MGILCGRAMLLLLSLACTVEKLVGSLEFLSSSKASLVTVAMLITIVLLQAWQL